MPTVMTLPAKLSGKLEQLALEAGCTPEKMLDCVMRDGFEYTEHFVRKVKQGIAEADAGQLVSHEEAMRRLQATIEKSCDPSVGVQTPISTYVGRATVEGLHYLRY